MFSDLDKQLKLIQYSKAFELDLVSLIEKIYAEYGQILELDADRSF